MRQNRQMCLSLNRKGSIAVEAAISLSIMIIVIAFLLVAIMSYQIEAAVAAALDNTAAEISLVIPLINTALENSDAAQEIIEDVDVWRSQQDNHELLSEILSEQAPDILSSLTFGRYISQRTLYWLNDASSGQRLALQLLDDISVDMYWQMEHNLLVLASDFEIKTVVGMIEKNVMAAVPLWIGKKQIDEHPLVESSENVWLLDNFSRGIQLRNHFGANLPLSYPVIAAFENGQAVSIRSIDLTAPTYQQNDSVISTLARDINRLAEFHGYHGSAKMPPINSEDISQRKMTLVIPANSPASFESEVLPELEMLAASRQVWLETVRYLDSSRYVQ